MRNQVKALSPMVLTQKVNTTVTHFRYWVGLEPTSLVEISIAFRTVAAVFCRLVVVGCSLSDE